MHYAISQIKKLIEGNNLLSFLYEVTLNLDIVHKPKTKPYVSSLVFFPNVKSGFICYPH